MLAHLRGNLLLLVLTLLLCCVLYPFVLWGVGRAAFRDKAEGSMIEKDGTVRGSKLIGQPFSGAGYFQPRPSAAGNGYNASLSGGSNLGASNIVLRNRVARLLGTTARFKSGDPVGPAIETWFADRTNPEKDYKPDEKIKPGETDAVTLWAANYSTPASAWVKGDSTNSDYVANWPDYEALVAQWRKETKPQPAPEAKPKPEDLAVYFFASFAKANPGKWPLAREQSKDGKPLLDDEGKPVKAIELVAADDDLRATFFEMWYQDVQPELDRVPADMVLASGSGLDPHITLRNARYQAPGVVEERVKGFPEKAKVQKLVEELLDRHAFTPMWGLAGGDPLVNVLELNLALDEAMKNLGAQK